MNEPIARRALHRLKRLLRKPPEKQVSPEKQFQRLLKTVRKSHIDRRHDIIRTAIESMTERDAIDSLQSIRMVKALAYPKAEVLLHAETRPSWLRHRAAMKEPWTVAWIESCLAEGEVLYDIGANTGVYALLAAKLHPGLRAVAFEPAFANFADLNRNVVLNGLEAQVTPLPYALSDGDRLLSFGFRNLEAGSALHGSEDDEVGKGGEGAMHVLPVVGRPLDTTVTALGLPLPQHVKIDVDGGELEVLAGGAATFAQPQLKTVMIEVTSTPGMGTEVDRFFAERGLTKAREFHKPTAHGDAERCWYGLYVRDPQSLPAEAFEGLKVGR